MVAIGGFDVPVPARAGRRHGIGARLATTLAVTILLVGMFTTCAGGLVWAGAILLGFAPWLTDAMMVVIAACSLRLAVLVCRRVWAAEGRLAAGGDVADTGAG